MLLELHFRPRARTYIWSHTNACLREAFRWRLLNTEKWSYRGLRCDSAMKLRLPICLLTLVISTANQASLKHTHGLGLCFWVLPFSVGSFAGSVVASGLASLSGTVQCRGCPFPYSHSNLSLLPCSINPFWNPNHARSFAFFFPFNLDRSIRIFFAGACMLVVPFGWYWLYAIYQPSRFTDTH